MPNWISDLIGGHDYLPALAVLVLLLVGAVKTWPWLRRVVRFLDRLIGDPEHPGLLDRMDAIEEKVAPILHEVKNNSGSSMKDAIDRTEVLASQTATAVEGLAEDMVDVKKKLGADNQRIEALEDTFTKPRHD